jgi:hypothetical protein
MEEAKASAIEKPSSGDAEVMAAIASLVPSNGQGGESVPAAEAGNTGPRWIAESVAISAEESGLVLEQQMEQATAAASAGKAIRKDTATAAAIEIPAAVEAVEPATAFSANVVDAIATESVPALVPTAAGSIAVDTSAVQGHTEAAEPAGAKEESAYAAAAAAGTSSEHMPAVETASAANPAAEVAAGTAASAEVAPQREAELAAAWQNWKQIRESFVSAPPAESATEVPDAASTTQEEAPASGPASADEAGPETAEAEAEAAAGDAPGESTAIASIVDTMLAELRPKLVEEIAKKMNSEKKEKEKKKKK